MPVLIYNLKSFLYLSCWFIPLIPYFGYKFFGSFYTTPLFVFVILGSLSFLIGEDKSKDRDASDIGAFERFYFKSIPRFYFLFYIIGSYLILDLLADADIYGIAWLIISWGLISSLATVSMHELCHSVWKPDEFNCRFLSGCVGYGHFTIEHMSHHALEGDYEMGCVAKRGESIYSFAMSHIPMGISSALERESYWCKKNGLSVFGNRIYQNFFITSIIFFLIHEFFGLVGVFVYTSQMLICWFSVCVIHYIQHYGLHKERYDKVDDGIAWEYNCFVGNVLTLNLSRHVHHHMKKFLPYYILKISPGSPRLVAGYSTAFLLAMIPPLWFSYMNDRLDAYMNDKKIIPPDKILGC